MFKIWRPPYLVMERIWSLSTELQWLLSRLCFSGHNILTNKWSQVRIRCSSRRKYSAEWNYGKGSGHTKHIWASLAGTCKFSTDGNLFSANTYFNHRFTLSLPLRRILALIQSARRQSGISYGWKKGSNSRVSDKKYKLVSVVEVIRQWTKPSITTYSKDSFQNLLLSKWCVWALSGFWDWWLFLSSRILLRHTQDNWMYWDCLTRRHLQHFHTVHHHILTKMTA